MANVAHWPLVSTLTNYHTTNHNQQSDVVELPILLPEWQVAALEEAAKDRGMTIGQLLRRLFADLFPLQKDSI